MFPAIFFLAGAVAWFFSSDNPNPPSELLAGPLPPASPPPPPPPDSGMVPRGISPQLFRRSAREVAVELQDLSQHAYRRLPYADSILVHDEGLAESLSRRLSELQEIAGSDPWAAREYDRPEIARYFYFDGSARAQEFQDAYRLNLWWSDPDRAREEINDRLQEEFEHMAEEDSTQILTRFRFLLEQLKFGERIVGSAENNRICQEASQRVLSSFPGGEQAELLAWLRAEPRNL